jgi:hypothetical protein
LAGAIQQVACVDERDCVGGLRDGCAGDEREQGE